MVFGFGTPNVLKMSEKLDVEGLIKALGYEKDCDVRRKAAKALGKIGDSRAVEPLMRAINDSDSEVRCAAAKALGEIGDYRAVGPLTKALDDTCVDVSTSAKEALHKMGISGGCGIA